MADNKQPFFWGWYVVLGAFLVLAVNYGVRYSFGIFLKPMAEEYGWSRSVISLGASFNMLVYSFCSIFIGKMVDRVLSPGRIIMTGALIVSLSLALVAFGASDYLLPDLWPPGRYRLLRSGGGDLQFLGGQVVS